MTNANTNNIYRILDATNFDHIINISRDADDAVLDGVLKMLGGTWIDWQDDFEKGLIMAGETAVAVLKAE